MRRLGIFFFFDADGVVDDYVAHYLAALAPHLAELIIVCNGRLDAAGRRTFARFTDQVLVRENEGYDVWAYKAGLEHYGWERLAGFDEVVLTNATLMGPVHPLGEMFAAMEARPELDFWGLTMHHGAARNPFPGRHVYAELPPHIQSHFFVWRRRLLASEALHTFWADMPMIESYTDSIQRYEAVFTRHFAEWGFRWDVYVDTRDLQALTDYPLLTCPDLLLRERRCPLFKRRSFMHPLEAYLGDTAGEAARALYAYLREESDYPLDLLWQNMLRTMHPHDFCRNLGLTRIIPAAPPAPPPDLRVALAMHLYFPELLAQSAAWAARFPPQTDVFITTDTVEKKAAVEAAFAGLDLHSVTVLVVENRGRDVAALLCDLAPHLRGYDVACFLHDKKAAQTRPGSVGRSFGYVCTENVCKSAAHVRGVLAEFAQDPRLGLLCPPFPTHGAYFMNLCSHGWGPNFDNTRRLLHTLGLRVPLAGNKTPIAPFGSVFWFRPAALAALFENGGRGWRHADFPAEPLAVDGTLNHAIERVYPFVAQAAGYYPAVVMSADFAVLRTDTLQAYAVGLMEPLARVLDGTTFAGAVAGAGALAARRHWRSFGPYERSRRRRARNWLRDRLPAPLYSGMMGAKRLVFGPRHGPYED